MEIVARNVTLVRGFHERRSLTSVSRHWESDGSPPQAQPKPSSSTSSSSESVQTPTSSSHLAPFHNINAVICGEHIRRHCVRYVEEKNAGSRRQQKQQLRLG